MQKVALPYDRPREKLQQKGRAALSTTELLQIVVGSGNAQAGVARIAKRVAKVLARHGSDVSFAQLLGISGLGPATASQIIVAFELASRYPMSTRQMMIDSDEKVLNVAAELRESKVAKLLYVTVDGARRLIAKRSLSIEDAHPAQLLRKIFADIASDNAAGIIIVGGSADRSVEPEMFDLTLARDLRVMAQLFMVTVHEHLLVNRRTQKSLRGESW